jgi:hypothetical protein
LLSRIQFGANISFHILSDDHDCVEAGCFCFSNSAPPETAKWMATYMFWVEGIFALSSFAIDCRIRASRCRFDSARTGPIYETVGNVAGPPARLK